MPFLITKLSNGKYQVKNKETGKIHSKGTTLKKAKGQVKLIEYLDSKK